MVNSSESRLGKCRDDDYLEDAPHFTFENHTKRGKTDGWNSVDHNNFVRMWDKNCDQGLWFSIFHF